MYNRLYSDLGQKKILYDKQFEIRGGHSNNPPLIELVDCIYNTFKKNKCILSVLLICQRYSTLYIRKFC